MVCFVVLFRLSLSNITLTISRRRTILINRTAILKASTIHCNPCTSTIQQLFAPIAAIQEAQTQLGKNANAIKNKRILSIIMMYLRYQRSSDSTLYLWNISVLFGKLIAVFPFVVVLLGFCCLPLLRPSLSWTCVIVDLRFD